MSDNAAIEAAARRLTAALDALEGAVERRREGDGLAEQLLTLGHDRSRLASDLDHMSARAKQLETANREVARRLDVAVGAIRSIIAEDEP